MSESDDCRFMRHALMVGAREVGRTWPNPAVGCVIVKDGAVVGRGWTRAGGRPHAETEALRRAGGAAAGATVYVTLEPCANWGQSAPCCKSLVEAGVRRVVIGCVDPDPRVNGKGIAWLREAGIEVETGVLEAEAREAHLGLYRRILAGRPAVALKLAQSLDGRIALANGQSRWITGPEARARGHLLRATFDAIMVGSGTALADDPMLDCRLPGLAGHSPLRIVLDRRLRLDPAARLVQTAAQIPLWIVTRADVDAKKRRRLEDAGAIVIGMNEPGIGAALRELAGRGITRLLVEGGAGVAAALLREGLVDRLHLFTGPMVLGSDARASVAGLGHETLDGVRRWDQIRAWPVGSDVLRVLAPKQE